MICKNCQDTIPEDSVFCPICGRKVEVETATEPICECSEDAAVDRETVEKKRVIR